MGEKRGWRRLEVSPLYERVATEIKRYILENQLRRGDRLPSEAELAELLAVSRSSVREGLRVLQMVGMVESRVGQGTFVGQSQLDDVLAQMHFRLRPSDADLVDLLEVRELLEVKAVELAADRIRQDNLTEMEDALERLQDNLRRGVPWVEEDVAFHRAIFRASGNRALLMMVDTIADLLRSVRRVGIGLADQEDEIAQHAAIYQALKEGDANKASELMARHVRTAATQILAALDIGRNGT